MANLRIHPASFASLLLSFTLFAMPAPVHAETCDEQFRNSEVASQVLDETGRVRYGAWLRKPTSDTVIVFVHGIFSNNRDAWLASANPCAYWPHIVAKDATFAGAGVFLAGYYAGFDAGNFDVPQAAKALHDVLTATYDQTFAPAQHPKIVFVAHSLGGIVTRRMLARHWSTFKQHSKVGLVLMASPSKGSAWADRADTITQKFRMKMAQQLHPEDPILNEIHNDFSALVKSANQGRSAGNELIVGTEQFENHLLMCSTWVGNYCFWSNMLARNIVDPREAGGYFGTAAEIVPETDHATIVKPYGTAHLSHVRLQSFFNRHFRLLLRSADGAGHGKLTLVGQKPVYGWKEVRRVTLYMAVHPGSCSATSPQGCRRALERATPAGNPPKVGDQRWTAVGGERIEPQGSSDYQFSLDLDDPDRPVVWAMPKASGPLSMMLYEKQFRLEHYTEIERQRAEWTSDLCPGAYCKFSVKIPSEVEVTEMRESTALGDFTTVWIPGTPVVGRTVRLADEQRSQAGRTFVFYVAPAYTDAKTEFDLHVAGVH